MAQSLRRSCYAPKATPQPPPVTVPVHVFFSKAPLKRVLYSFP